MLPLKSSVLSWLHEFAFEYQQFEPGFLFGVVGTVHAAASYGGMERPERMPLTTISQSGHPMSTDPSPYDYWVVLLRGRAPQGSIITVRVPPRGPGGLFIYLFYWVVLDES
jgi:hypothetical protein